MITWGASRSRQPDLATHESAILVQGTVRATHRRTAHADATTLQHRGGVGVCASDLTCSLVTKTKICVEAAGLDSERIFFCYLPGKEGKLLKYSCVVYVTEICEKL